MQSKCAVLGVMDFVSERHGVHPGTGVSHYLLSLNLYRVCVCVVVFVVVVVGHSHGGGEHRDGREADGQQARLPGLAE